MTPSHDLIPDPVVVVPSRLQTGSMVFADLEREWNRRKRGRRKERMVLAAAIVVFLALAGAVYWYFRLRG